MVPLCLFGGINLLIVRVRLFYDLYYTVALIYSYRGGILASFLGVLKRSLYPLLYSRGILSRTF